MFIDLITVFAAAGRGGDGVTRWRHEKYVPKAGPAGGNGGRGGDVYVEAVTDLGLLAKYTSNPRFLAEDGEAGHGGSRDGRNGKDVVIKVPVGSVVTDVARGRYYEMFTAGQREKVFTGGNGGYGNERFKSSTNRAPENSTEGRSGEAGELRIELTLVVDVGFIGLPNAGKSTLLNALTNATSTVGAYPFTTTVPYLGDFNGHILADIPGLIEGASQGKGLGHTFLRHVTKTKMVLHLVSLEQDDPLQAYYIIRKELKEYGHDLDNKEEWILLTKNDLKNKDYIEDIKKSFDKINNNVFVISAETGEGILNLRQVLEAKLLQS